MTLERTTNPDVNIVPVPKRLETGNARDFEAELRQLLAASPKNMVLDFSGTEYIASAGLRVMLVITRDLMKAGGKVALFGLRPPVHKVFEMAGFTSIFPICGTRDEAVQKVL